MADQNVDVRIRVTKTGSGAQDTVNDLKRIQTQAGGVGSSLKTALGGMGSMFGALGLAAGAAAVVKFGRDTVMAASAAAEVRQQNECGVWRILQHDHQVFRQLRPRARA